MLQLGASSTESVSNKGEQTGEPNCVFLEPDIVGELGPGDLDNTFWGRLVVLLVVDTRGFAGFRVTDSASASEDTGGALDWDEFGDVDKFTSFA